MFHLLPLHFRLIITINWLDHSNYRYKAFPARATPPSRPPPPVPALPPPETVEEQVGWTRVERFHYFKDAGHILTRMHNEVPRRWRSRRKPERMERLLELENEEDIRLASLGFWAWDM